METCERKSVEEVRVSQSPVNELYMNTLRLEWGDWQKATCEQTPAQA